MPAGGRKKGGGGTSKSSKKKGGGSKSSKSSWKPKASKNKTKYRPQDPVFNRMGGLDADKNNAPKGDADMRGIPEPVNAGGAMLPGLAMLPPGLGALPNPPADGADGKAAKRHKRGGARPVGPEAGAGSAVSAPPAPALPKQRPGESARAYSARLGKAAEEQLRGCRGKLNTEHHREKKRKRAKTKKKAAEEKRSRAAEQEESRERVHFGDIVIRPPIMSSAALKSRSSLKAQAKDAEGTQPASDLGAYADKVREAYAALRKRRLGES